MMGSRSHPPRLQSGRVVLASVLVLDELGEDVCVSVYGEVESVRAVNPRLPNVSRLVIFLGAERRVLEVSEEIFRLFVQFFTDRFRQFAQLLLESIQVTDSHDSSDAISSSTESKVRLTFPSSISCSASVSCRSTSS